MKGKKLVSPNGGVWAVTERRDGRFDVNPVVNGRSVSTTAELEAGLTQTELEELEGLGWSWME